MKQLLGEIIGVIGLLGLMLLPQGLLAQQPVPGRPARVPADTTQAPTDSAQKRVRILNADRLSFRVQNDTALQKLLGNVRLVQDTTYFYCDSALFFDAENRLEAYGKVRIEMPDSVTLLARRLTYDGNTRIARLYQDILLTDQGSRLTTDTLIYYRREEFGYYQGGGKLVDDSTTLTSKIGYYYPNRDLAYFRDSVKLVHPDFTLYTDTLGYDTKRKVAQFVTRTRIDSKDGEIETTSGTYETQISKVSLFERSVLRDSSFTLTADTLYYTDRDDLGLALGHVVISQEDSSVELRGNYGRFNRQTDESLLTRNAVVIQRMEDDTLYMFADTLYSVKDTQFLDRENPSSAQPPAPATDSPAAAGDSLTTGPDSLASDTLTSDGLLGGEPDLPTAEMVADTLAEITLQEDSLSFDSASLAPEPMAMGPPTQEEFQRRIDTVVQRVFRGYRGVTFFMNQMQGRADSMIYFYDDSVMFLYQDPVLWSEENQLSGDVIGLWMKNEQADSMQVDGNTFMVSKADTVGFNQLKASEMQVKFRDNGLYRLRMLGNSESIYFVEEQPDSSAQAKWAPVSYQGMNKALANQMEIYFEDNEVVRIVFLSKPEGTFSPMYEVLFKENRLDGMQWRIDERPEKPRYLLSKPPIEAMGPLPGTEAVDLPPAEAIPAAPLPAAVLPEGQ